MLRSISTSSLRLDNPPPPGQVASPSLTPMATQSQHLTQLNPMATRNRGEMVPCSTPLKLSLPRTSIVKGHLPLPVLLVLRLPDQLPLESLLHRPHQVDLPPLHNHLNHPIPRLRRPRLLGQRTRTLARTQLQREMRPMLTPLLLL